MFRAPALIQRSCIPPGTALNENFISCQDLALALPIFVNAKVLKNRCAGLPPADRCEENGFPPTRP